MEPTLSLSEIKIRPATDRDLSAMEWEGEYAHFRRLYAEAYRQMEKGDALLWVVENSSQALIGQLFVQLRSARIDLADGDRRAYIYGFRIKPPYRNKGIGTRAMEVVEKDLIKRGYRWVSLNVAQDNPGARRLYERLGYRVSGSDPGRWSYVDNKGLRRDVNEPAWRMEKELDRSEI